MANEFDQKTQNRRHRGFWSKRRNQFWVASLIAIILILVIIGIAFFVIRKGSNLSKATYNGDSLLRVFPKSETDQNFLQKFDQLNISAQVWGLPLNPSVPVYVYVKSGAMKQVQNAFQGKNITFSILIEDLQRLIDREEKSLEERRYRDTTSEEFDFETYHPLEEIKDWLQKLSKSNPMVKVSPLGTTYENRNVLVVSISSKQRHDDHGVAESSDKQETQHLHQEEKPIIYINCGIHAREWVAIASCLWMINEMANPENPDSAALLDNFDFWFVPVANPDGYVYTWTTDRMWRKNRVPNDKCFGVDLNRNFNVDFNGTSKNGCSNSFGGIEAASEAETKLTIDLLKKNKDRIKAALFLHSFSQLWMSPYGFNTTLPQDYPRMQKVMSSAVEAIKRAYGTVFQFGSISNVLYAASGTAIDYAYHELGIVHSYLVELRDTGTNGFMLPIEQILPTAKETWDGIRAMAVAVKAELPAKH